MQAKLGFRKRPIGRSALRILLAFLFLGFSQGRAGAQTPVLHGQGGDAWTFTKRIEGSVIDGDCDTVIVTSPAGAFRAWREGERFAAAITLHEGMNEVRAICRNDGEERRSASSQSWNVRLKDRPKAWIRAVPRGEGMTLDAGRSELAPARPARIVRYEWRARPGNPAPLYPIGRTVPLEAAHAGGEQLALQTPAADGEYYVTLRIVDALGRADVSTMMFRVRDGRPQAIDLSREHPAWVDAAVVYGVVPFFFGRRGFDDVTERLDEIAALGANVLWLSPVTASPRGDFGYAVIDHFRLRDTFGSMADLRELVDAAHRRGLRVIMDFVPNHVSDRHAYYMHAERNGRASPYFAFFERGDSGEATHYFDWANLKNLNYDNSEVQRHVIEAFAHWVRDLNIDGFRVDASWGIRQRAPEFWPRWREELKRIKPDLLLLAEASARDPYYVLHGFDAAYDWTDKLGQWAWKGAFDDGSATAARLRAALRNDAMGSDSDALVFRFLNNNDTGARFIARHGPLLTRVAATMLLTLPGLPCIYTGDEVGAEFEPYAEGPPIGWHDPHGLQAHYKRLVALRRAEPSLRSRAFQLIDTSESDRVLAYLRPGASHAESLLVVLNYGAQPARTRFARTASVEDVVGSGLVVDVLSGESLTIDPTAPEVQVKGYTARILRGAVAD